MAEIGSALTVPRARKTSPAKLDASNVGEIAPRTRQRGRSAPNKPPGPAAAQRSPAPQRQPPRRTRRWMPWTWRTTRRTQPASLPRPGRSTNGHASCPSQPGTRSSRQPGSASSWQRARTRSASLRRRGSSRHSAESTTASARPRQREMPYVNEAQQVIEALNAECIQQDALLAKDQEELQVAQSLHQAWIPTAKEGEAVSQPGQQPQDVAAAAERTERQRDLLNRLYIALPAKQNPDLLKELAGSLGTPATQEPAQEWRLQGPRKPPNRAGSSRRAPMRALGKRPQGPEPEAPVRTEPRRGQPKGPPTAAPGRTKPNSCEATPEARPHLLGNYSMARRSPATMVPPGRTRSPLTGAPSSP